MSEVPESYLLYLIRHARAEERGDDWPDDRARPLSSEGVRRMARAADGLASIGVEVDLIVTSPFVRTVETARILSKRTRGRPRVDEVRWLEPGTPSGAIYAGLASLDGPARLAIVGHEPEMGELAAWLLGAEAPVAFKKGAVACFELNHWPPEPTARLLWFMPSKLLEQL